MQLEGGESEAAVTPRDAATPAEALEAPQRVLFVMGFPRCGSTLLARLLDQLDGWGAIGEAVDQLYCSRRIHVAPCGCGAPVPECNLWRDLIAEIDDDARRFVTRYLRLRYLPLLALQWRPRRMRALEQRFQAEMRRIFSRASSRIGAHVVVDTSKLPAYALALARVPGLDVAAIHLVRDLRAVVASNARPKAYLRRVSMLRVVVWWTILALASDWLLRSGRVRGARLRYEDLVARPADAVTAVGRLVGDDAPSAAHLESRTADLGARHLLGCNPDKLDHGLTRIAAREWTLPGWQRWLVTILGSPLLARFGYLARSRSGSAGPSGP